MAVKVKTAKPKTLLAAIYKAIDEGHIDTWKYEVRDGVKCLTHYTSDRQWYKKAWFKPKAGVGLLTFLIQPPGGGKIPTEVYAVYHGRLIEMLLAHFKDLFDTATATAKAV